jgi:hypothetical protein
MRPRFTAGQYVHTPFGKGLIREVRDNGRLLIDLRGRALLLGPGDVTLVERGGTPPSTPAGRYVHTHAGRRDASDVPSTVDLHGCTVPDAIARAEQALNEALLADLPELRVVHGRRGGRIRTALHRWLRDVPGVRGFHVDPRNPGVTIIRL